MYLAKRYSPSVRRTLMLFLCLCGGLGIPQHLWGQDYCADETAKHDQIKQWVEYDRMTGKNTLEYNQGQLIHAEKAWETCMQHQFGSVPKVNGIGEDGELVTFPKGSCFKSRDFAKDFNAKGTAKIKEIFDGQLGYEQKVVAVGLLSAPTKQVADALFFSCLDYVQNRIDLKKYQENKQAYEELRDFKRVSKAQDISSGQVSVGCTDGAGLQTPVLYFGKSPQITASSAAWARTDNLKNQDQAIIDEIHDPTSGALIGMRAHSHMQGLDRNWVGNCPGGGHGEVVMHVEWTELVPININKESASGQ